MAKKYKVDKVNSYNGWGKLRQCILGTCYDNNFFDDMDDDEVRPIMQKLVKETNEDLDNIQLILENFGVEVIRAPSLYGIPNGKETKEVKDVISFKSFKEYEQYAKTDYSSLKAIQQTVHNLPRPLITPRDYLISLGDKILLTIPNSTVYEAFKDVINPDCFDVSLPSQDGFWAPFVVRVGDSLIIDKKGAPAVHKYIKHKYPKFNVIEHKLGGQHSDGVFNTIKPGYAITQVEKIDCSDTFPGWTTHLVEDDENAKERKRRMREKTSQEKINKKDGYKLENIKKQFETWAHPDQNNGKFSDFVEEWLSEWTGFLQETVFEVNILVIDEKNVLCLNYNEGVWKYFESIGVTPHIAPFRHRNFWDGGLHCLTVDTIRDGGPENVIPWTNELQEKYYGKGF